MTREIVVSLDAAARRPLRAVDFQPGTRSLVRSARVTVRTAAGSAGDVERLLALWVPGDQPVALPSGAAFAVPDGFGGDEVFALRTSLNFIDAWWEIFGALGHGVPLQVVPGDVATDPLRLPGFLA